MTMYTREGVVHLVKRKGMTNFLLDVLQGNKQTYICPFAINRNLVVTLETSSAQNKPKKLLRIVIGCLHYPHTGCTCAPTILYSGLYEPSEFGLEEDFEF